MPKVEVERITRGANADEMFARVAAFDQYPEIAESVRSVEVDSPSADVRRSRWEVDFRGGILRWEEEEIIDRAARSITFRLIAGDIPELDGGWVVEDRDGEVAVRFEARFDLGMPSIAPLIDPVAERELRATVVQIIKNLSVHPEFEGGR